MFDLDFCEKEHIFPGRTLKSELGIQLALTVQCEDMFKLSQHDQLRPQQTNENSFDEILEHLTSPSTSPAC